MDEKLEDWDLFIMKKKTYQRKALKCGKTNSDI